MHIFHRAAQEPKEEPTRTAVLWNCIYYNSFSVLKQWQHHCYLSSGAVSDYFRSHLGELNQKKAQVKCRVVSDSPVDSNLFVAANHFFSPLEDIKTFLWRKSRFEKLSQQLLPYCEGKALKKAGLKSQV